MRIQIDITVPQWTKWLVAGLSLGVVLGIGVARVYAEPVTLPKTWAEEQVLTAAELNGNFAALKSRIDSLEQSLGKTSDAVGRTNTVLGISADAAGIPFYTYDYKIRTEVATNMTVAQAFCTARFGIWDAATGQCKSPLKYGTTADGMSLANVPRDVSVNGTDKLTFDTCGTGYVPVDCSQAMFLLNFWRLSPQSETPVGHAWCTGSVDPRTPNSVVDDLVGSPGYWYPGGNIAARPVCPENHALVVDQSSTNLTEGASNWRPHLYCRPVTELNPWLCVATNVP